MCSIVRKTGYGDGRSVLLPLPYLDDRFSMVISVSLKTSVDRVGRVRV